MSAILTHLFKRNCWVPIGELVAVTQCSRGQIDALLRFGKIEVCNNHATGEEFRIIVVGWWCKVSTNTGRMARTTIRCR